MSILSRASCLALFLVLYSPAEHSTTRTAQVIAPRQAAESWRQLASELELETFYCPTAYARAPFVTVHALFRNSASGPARGPARPDDQVDGPVSPHHFLLSGQKTAELRPAAESDVWS